MGHMSVLLQLPVALQVPTHGRHPAALPRPHPFARLQLIFPIVCLHFCTKHAPCCLQESQCEHPMQEAARLWFENFPSPLNHAKVSSLSSDKVIKSSLSVPVQINTELSMTLIFTACIKDVKHSIRKDLKVFQERCRWQP